MHKDPPRPLAITLGSLAPERVSRTNQSRSSLGPLFALVYALIAIGSGYCSRPGGFLEDLPDFD
jgi:hypothetical protein